MIQSHDAIAQFESKYRTLRSSCPERFARRYEAFHGSYEVELTKRPEMPATGSLTTAAFGDLRVAITRWNSAIRGTVLSKQEHFCLRVPLAGTAKTLDPNCGMTTSGPNEIGIFRARQGVSVIGSTDNAAINLAIPAAPLEERAKTYAGYAPSRSLAFTSHLSVHSPEGQAVAGMISCLLSQAVCFPGVFDNRLVQANMGEYVTSLMLGLLPHNHRDVSSNEKDVAVPDMVRRAEDYMRANAGQPLTLQMLAQEAGCSERALQNAFKRFRDQTPMTVLRDIRLELARRDIEQRTEPVANIALRWGFSNPGRFAAQYADRFGEPPGRTARLTAA